MKSPVWFRDRRPEIRKPSRGLGFPWRFMGDYTWVISGTILVGHIRGLIAPLKTTPEPPSKAQGGGFSGFLLKSLLYSKP